MARVLPITPAAVPGLDEVVTDPSRATALPRGTLQALLHRCVAAQTILLGALTAAEPDKGSGEPDRLLDVAAAAQRLAVSRDWLYHHAHQLPFTVRQGRLLRFSTAGIARYIRSRQGG
jgi:predicted DNA-binding transcriptional regulator AlpA